jgi:hypothetical protein
MNQSYRTRNPLVCLEQEGLDLIVQHKHESATSSSQHVGESALEEGVGSFDLGNLGPAVQGVLVLTFGNWATRLHHHSSTNGVERIRDDTGHGGDGLSDQPGDHQRGVLRVWQHSLGSVEESEVGGTVDDDTLHRHDETAVQTEQTVGFGDLNQTVGQTIELPTSDLADVGGQTGTREIERVHEAQRSGTGSSTAGQVTSEVTPELLVLVNTAQEHLLVLVFERKVQSLGREVTDHIGHVTTPERAETLFTWDTHEAVNHTCLIRTNHN